MTDSPDRTFVFENYGGSYQLRIETADDLRALHMLDEPFWVATSAPVRELRADPALLSRLDRDGNGRILSSDIRVAVDWMFRVLGNVESVDQRREFLRIDDLNSETDEGRTLREAAERILRNVGEAGAGILRLEHVRDRQAIVSRAAENGDGVIPPSAATDDALRAFIEDVMDAEGSVQDLTGEPGVDEEALDRFVKNAAALLEWRKKEAPGGEGAAEMFPLGDATAHGYGLLRELREPVETYFELCKVVDVNRVLGRETPQPASPPEAFEDRETAEEYLRRAPLARPRPEAFLPFEEDVNPLYEDRLRKFGEAVVRPLLKDAHDSHGISEAQWEAVARAFAPYERWLEAKTGGEVERLGPDKLNAYLAGNLPARLRDLIRNDCAAGPEIAAASDLEFLMLLQRWVIELCNNFVSFPYLFDPDHRAMFEQGRVVMDGKIFNLNLRVEDIEEHSRLAERSGIYLMYSEVTRGNPEQKFFMVTPVARVDLGNLGVDKRGVLFDREGIEWDVRVVKVVDNVVSLKQALLQPFRKIGHYAKESMAKLSTGAEERIQQSVTQPGAAEPPAAAKANSLRDMVLAGGLSAAALGASFTYIGNAFGDGWVVLRTLAIVVAVLLIPVALYAAIKLYLRNLSGLLEASGWAINARMRLTRTVSRIICVKPRRPSRGFVESSADRTQVFSRRREDEGTTKPENEE